MPRIKKSKKSEPAPVELKEVIGLLAAEVREGFGDVAELFRDVGDRFERVERSIDQLTTTVANLSQGVDAGFGRMEHNIDQLTTTVSDLAKHGGERFERVDQHFDRVEHSITETREVLSRAMKGFETRLIAHVGDPREDVDKLKAWMEDIDTRLSALEVKRPPKAA